MPSTLVHVAFGGLLAAALLGPAFGRRAVLAVLALAAAPDLDSFAAIWLPGAHRALLHNLVVPAVLAAACYADLRRGEDAWLRGRLGGHGPRVAAVGLAAYVLAGVGPDLVTNGVNPLYPVVDRYVTLDGRALLSSTRGLVQTFVEFREGGGHTTGGTTANTFYYTGVNVERGADPARAERVFPLISSGMQLLVVLLSAVALLGRFRDEKR